VVVDHSALAREIGARLRAARLKAGLTQQQLAQGRYTKAYVSALEHGLVKPSVAALTFFAERLGIAPSDLLVGAQPAWTRLEADLLLAAGRWQEAADAYRTLLETETDQGRRAELLLGLAEALARLDHPADSAAVATEAHELFTRAGDRARAALAAFWLAAAEYALDNLQEARSILQTTLDAVRGGLAVEPGFKQRLLMALSSVESRAGNHSVALSYLEEVRSDVGELDLRRRAAFYFDLAYSYRELGDYEAALRMGLSSLTLFRASEAELEVAAVENDLALAHLALGNLERAAAYAREAEARFRRLGDTRMLAHVLETRAAIAHQGGALEEALDLARQALQVADASANPKARLAALLRLAQINDALDARDEALATFAQAAELARALGQRARIREVLAAWADALERAGRLEEAYRVAREALAQG
jgi:tetratricopeptide (TPR) repeat protein